MDEFVRTAWAADGTRLRYRVSGDGPPLILLHGSLSGPSTFRKLQTFLPSRCRVILPIMRGHDGDGEATGLPADYGIATTELNDLRSVLDAEEIGNGFDLIAHSTGGATAVALAISEPERLRRMVLIEPTLLSLLEEPVATRVRADITAISRADERRDRLAALNGLLDFIGSPTVPPTVRQRALDTLASLAWLAAPHLRALLELRVTDDEIRQLKPHTLLVYGTASAYFEEPIAARLAALRPDYPQLQVAGASHLSHAQKPEIVGLAAARHLAG